MYLDDIEQDEGYVINSTFVANQANDSGGGIAVLGAGGLEVYNATLFGNEASHHSEIIVLHGESPIIRRSLVGGGFSAGAEILDADPLFVRPPNPGPDGSWGTDDDDYGDLRLLQDSPAIDFGLSLFLPADVWDLDDDGDTTEPLPIDLNGDARVQGQNVDLGVYEGPGIVANERGVPNPSESSLQVYPNPANEVLVIESTIGLIEIMDVLGRRVLATRSDNGEIIIDIAALSPGIYIVQAGRQNGLFTVQR